MEGSYKEEEERQGTEGSEGTSRRGSADQRKECLIRVGVMVPGIRGRAGVPRLSSSQSGRVVSASPGDVRISAPTPETSHRGGPGTLRSRVILQVSLNVLKPEKPCGEEEASELQGFIPAGRVPSPLSRDEGSAVERVSSTLALGLAGGGSLGPLLMRMRGPGTGAPWIRRAPWTSRSSSPGGKQEPRFSPGPFCP